MTNQASESSKDHGINAVLDQALQSYEKLPMLQIIFNKLVRSLSVALRHFITDDVEVEIASFSSQRFAHFGKCLNPNSAISVVKMLEWERFGLVTCNQSMVMTLIESLLGGKKKPQPYSYNRAYTPIEQSIIKQTTNLILGELTKAFQQICNAKFVFDRLESNANVMRLYRPAEAVISLQLKVTISGSAEELIVMLPYSTLEPIKHKLQQILIGEKLSYDKDWQSDLQHCTRNIDLPLEVKITDTSKKWLDIVNLQVGNTIALNHEEHQAIDITCEKLLLFRGQLGKIRNKVAINISEVCLKK